MSTGGDDFKELVRSRTDIVALIGEVVQLTPLRGGREYQGLCPFHDDHNPSMRVNPERQSFRCWSCNTGGDCFSFVTLRERCSFPEALEMLARRANLPLPDSLRKRGGLQTDDKNSRYALIAWAEDLYHKCLLHDPSAERARRYLAGRGLGVEIQKAYRLGYHPPDWHWLLNKGLAQRLKPNELEAVKLIGEGERGYYDNFVDRVLFPIHDASGRPIAFGGRVLPDSPATSMGKYWNSPEHPLFHKSRCLFGLHHARDAIVKSGTAVVMEGYTDCIAAHIAGVRNVVATLGTAMTEEHVMALKRLSRKIVLVYDGDAAGQKATDRAIPMFLQHEIDLRILTLPDNLDPAEFIDERGPAAFAELVESALEAWDYKFRSVIAKYGLGSIDARHRVLTEMLEALASVPHDNMGLAGVWQTRESVIIGRLVQRLGIPERQIREQLAQVRQKGAQQAALKKNNTPATSHAKALHEMFPAQPTRDDLVELDLLALIFAYPELVSAIRSEIRVSEVRNDCLRALYEVCLRAADDGCPPTYKQVTLRLEDENLKSLATFVAEHSHKAEVKSEGLEHALGYFRKRRLLENGLARVEQELSTQSEAGLTPDVLELLRQATKLNQQRVKRPDAPPPSGV